MMVVCETIEDKHLWRVVPLSKGQLEDVRPEDILNGGLYRKCDVYRGGGGYDRFPDICEKRLGIRAHDQFVVQLFGCHLDCPYCYVTRAGVWGAAARVSTQDLVKDYVDSGQSVFHLMGGAPALAMKYWPELLDVLFDTVPNAIFHSDLLLTERTYDARLLQRIAMPNCLYAIDVKGIDAADWQRNTRKPFNETMFWENFRRVRVLGNSVYVTFTNAPPRGMDIFWEKAERNGVDVDHFRLDSFNIELIEYHAQPFIDEVSWGRGLSDGNST